ncbi:MAG: hypothetical protein DMG30_22825 [Acidobacteria bacterium]|nr:MAG: hypothetical protein DMG30_22825 [Acidobacteriota bacterium]
MFARKVIGLLGLTLFVLPFFSVASARAISHRTGDSTAVSNLLLQARKDAMQLRNDAEDLQSFNRSKMSWESHSMKLSQIRDDINSLGVLVTKLNQERTKGHCLPRREARRQALLRYACLKA